MWETKLWLLDNEKKGRFFQVQNETKREIILNQFRQVFFLKSERCRENVTFSDIFRKNLFFRMRKVNFLPFNNSITLQICKRPNSKFSKAYHEILEPVYLIHFILSSISHFAPSVPKSFHINGNRLIAVFLIVLVIGLASGISIGYIVFHIQTGTSCIKVKVSGTIQKTQTGKITFMNWNNTIKIIANIVIGKYVAMLEPGQYIVQVSYARVYSNYTWNWYYSLDVPSDVTTLTANF